jgi:tetratricopeptide (TPR) repeat protein
VADELYRCAKFEEASKEFDIVLQMKPADFWAEYLNALCLLRLHRPAEAKTQLSACLAQRADFVWLYLLRGFANGELQAFDAATADFAKALELPHDDSAGYVLFVNRGGMRIRQGLLDEAIADLNSAIQLKPKEYQAYVNLANAYRYQSKLDLALEQLNRAIQIDATQAHLYRLRARLLLERKEPALALADFNRAIERESSENPFYVEDLVERGRLLLREQKSGEALASFDAALQVSSKHLAALRLKGEALMHLGRHQEAIDAYDRYLETGKPLESVYRGRGLALAELGKYPGAIESFTRALDLEPTSAVQTFRGWAHLVCEAPKLALRDFELAIDLDPKNGDAYNGRGFVQAQLGKRSEAIRDAEEAVRLGPQTPRLLYNSARVLAQCAGDKLTRAVELIEKALNLLPSEERETFWLTNIKNDNVMGIIRIHPKFQKLQAEILQKK